VPEVAGNPLLIPPGGSIVAVNLRQRYRDGLAQLDTISAQRFSKRFIEIEGAPAG